MMEPRVSKACVMCGTPDQTKRVSRRNARCRVPDETRRKRFELIRAHSTVDHRGAHVAGVGRNV